MGVKKAALVSALLCGLASIAATSHALGPWDLPRSDRAPRIEDGALVVDSLGTADGVGSRISAIRARARETAVSRGKSALHRFVDAELARLRAPATTAQAAHRAIDGDAAVLATRPLSEGSAVVRIAIPTSSLCDAARIRGASWCG
jgi:hypothetical protein